MRAVSLCVLLAMGMPALAMAADSVEASPPPAGTARIRLIGESGTTLTITPQQCDRTTAATPMLRMREDIRIIKAPDNSSIGIPATSASRSIDSAMRVLSFKRKPYYHEYTLPAGAPMLVAGNYSTGNAYCRGTLHLGFIPVAGMDYEVSMGAGTTHCQLAGRRVAASGNTFPLASIARASPCDETLAKLGEDTLFFMFEPESVFYRLNGGLLAAPETMGDEEALGDAFQTRVTAALQRPGIRTCVVIPTFDHTSPLFLRLQAALKQQGEDVQAIYAESTEVPHAPGNAGMIGYREAQAYCSLALLQAYPGKEQAP